MFAAGFFFAIALGIYLAWSILRSDFGSVIFAQARKVSLRIGQPFYVIPMQNAPDQ
jgi:hypothetical protein